MAKAPDSSALSSVSVEDSINTTAAEIDVNALGLEINNATMDAWSAIRDALTVPPDTTSQETSSHSVQNIEPGGDLSLLNLIVGAGLGVSTPIDDDGPGGPPGTASVVLYLAEPIAPQQAINYAASVFHADALASDEAHIRLVHTGPIDLLSHRFRMRPAPGGVSIGHRDITAGTLGCLCKGKKAPRDERMLVLSNNHVLANVNAGAAGDPIYQPGPHDGSTPPQNAIGILEQFVPIQTTAVNYVDCATAWVDEDDVRADLVYLRNQRPQFFRASSPTVSPRVNMTVGKSGRTTQMTAGRITEINAIIDVNLGNGQIARFVDQIAIQGLTAGLFSKGGDSGSLIWTWDADRHPVGLLFAGSQDTTFANPVDSVLKALDIDLVL